jgi:hypothetical protein
MPIIRVVSTDWVEMQVQSLARKEGRSLSGMALRLLNEALDARKAATNDVNKIVAIIRGAVSAAPAQPADDAAGMNH